MQSLQFDLLFAHFIIADITSGLKNCLFAEIAPRTIYPLYGIGFLVYKYKWARTGC